MNPGGGIITKLKGFRMLTPPIALVVTNLEGRIEQGSSFTFRLQVTNQSDHQIQIEPDSLSIVLVTHAPYSKVITNRGNKNAEYWYYGDSLWLGDQKYQAACRQIALPWTPEYYAKEGTSVTIGPHTPTHRQPGAFYPLLIGPRGCFTTDVTIGQELLPGEYQVFLHFQDGQYSYHTTNEIESVSRRINLDVFQGGQE
jgi:hypothetical protein